MPQPKSPDVLRALAWAELADLLDLQLSPLGLGAIEALEPRPGETILDVGCGAGQTTLQLAERVGPSGRAIGVDIAASLLDIARRRAAGVPNTSFIDCDARTLALPEQSLDALYSRFGVMAFPDPVATFANLRRLLRPTGRLAFVCWRSLADNELDALPVRAAGLAHLADPTPFSFEAPAHTRATLEAAGFHDVAIAPHDAQVSCGDLAATMAVLLRVGALGKIVRERPELREEAEAKVRAALAAKGSPSRVSLNAATWIVTARA